MSVISENGLYWLRSTTAIAALIPFHFWIVKEAISSDWQEVQMSQVWRGSCWLLITGCLAGLCFSDFFIPSHSTPERRLYGTGYYVYIIGSLGLYLALGLDALVRIRQLAGGRRLALQVWFGGGISAAATILILMAVNMIARDPFLSRVQPMVVLLFYTVTAIAITTYRVFDARQILVVAVQKLLLVSSTAGMAYAVEWCLVSFLPSPIDLVVTTGIALWFAGVLGGWMDKVFMFFPQGVVARQRAFEVASRETRVEVLEQSFSNLLKGWGHSDHALVLSGPRDQLRGNGMTLSGEDLLVRAMRQLRWVTPERLVRERPTLERDEVGKFLRENSLGALVIGEGPTLTALIGVGVAVSRRPFTYPQVTQLLELASIMESALERAHFSAKAQHSEQLATVGLLGANLAHEIRNPLVSIKTFVQLLPTHHQDPVFREKFFRLIGDEVKRIDELTEQLLDLAAPRNYKAELIDLHAVLQSSLDLVEAKATQKQVQFLTDFHASPDRVFTDPAAAKQVMLNLCFNAIQAVEHRDEAERWIRISTRNVDRGVEMAIADNGPGIAADMQQRLFQPFQTTKSTGFGLGLAICRDILANLHASVSVDPPLPGQGATFRVTYPCQASSS
jgi:signal transduction histidine kinase